MFVLLAYQQPLHSASYDVLLLNQGTSFLRAEHFSVVGWAHEIINLFCCSKSIHYLIIHLLFYENKIKISIIIYTFDLSTTD
jgi:hypothetical protein